MGIIDDFNKISKFQEKYAFLNDSKFRKVISGLTNGLVTTVALEHMNLHITNLAEGIKLIDVKKENTKQYDEIWDKLQKGFIDYAYEMYQPKPGEKRLSKNAYFNLVIDAIEMCPHEKVVETKEWCKIYNIALTEKEAYNNQKNLEFVEKAAKIDDMHKRYEKASTDYFKLENNYVKRKARIDFEKLYGKDIQKLDSEISAIEKSEKFQEAKKKVEQYNIDKEQASNLYKQADKEAKVSEDEYKKFYDNTMETAFKKNSEKFENLENFKSKYRFYLMQKVALEEVRKLKEEIDKKHPEFLDKQEEISRVEKEIAIKKEEKELLLNERNEIKDSLVEKYKTKMEIYVQRVYTEQAAAYINLFVRAGGTIKDDELDELGELDDKLDELDELDNDELEKDLDQERLKKLIYENVSLKDTLLQLKEKIKEVAEKDVAYYEKYDVYKEPDFGEVHKKMAEIDATIKDKTDTKNNLKKPVNQYHEKLKSYYDKLRSYSLLPEEARLSKQDDPEELRNKTSSIDLDSISKKLNNSIFSGIEETLKPALEKKEQMRAEANRLDTVSSNISKPKEASDIISAYDYKVKMQKEVNAFNDAKNKLTEVETELHSNDYKMEEPDLLGDIKNTAGSYWARRDMRKGLHINTKEFNTMINAVKDLKDLDFKGKTSINELNKEEREKLGKALIEARDKAKEYLKAKMKQNRKHESALRQTRLGYALALVDGLEEKMKNLDKVNKKYAEVEKAIAGKEKQLEEWKKNPILVDPAKLKTNVNEVKAAETTAAKKESEIQIINH